MPPPSSQSRPPGRDRMLTVAPWVALGVGLLICLVVEWRRLQVCLAGGGGVALWLTHWDLDSTWPLLLFGLLPLCSGQFPSGRRTLASRLARALVWPQQRPAGTPAWRAVALGLIVGATSFACSASVGSMHVGPTPKKRFATLPPAYHDEYSYRLMARTFLDGRFSYDSHPAAPQLFDQMHVLNEGRFASRYFPWTGAWIAPFLAIGRPILGHWIAGALTAVLIFVAGREVAGDGVGFLAGLLTAVSPGMALFSNLLLAHHPTVLALALFLAAFLRFMKSRSVLSGLVAGTGLALAMLGRPMAAAGFALPFGVWLVDWLVRGNDPGWAAARRLGRVVTVGAPVLAGLVFLSVYSKAITGEALVTPYQLYTNLHTPRHVYGFNNRVRGEQRLGPKVIAKYDEWAENLDGPLAARNVRDRVVASFQWTAGLVPLALATIAGLLLLPAMNAGGRLVFASLISVHLAHVPYWYAGIMNWHYVFECGPLLALVLAISLGRLTRHWTACGRVRLPGWCLALTASTVGLTWLSCAPFPSESRVHAAVETMAFSRVQYDRFADYVRHAVRQRPALVLVTDDPADRHIDYVVNNPPFDADVLFCRYRPDAVPVEDVRRLFPRRHLYLYDVIRDRFGPVPANGLPDE